MDISGHAAIVTGAASGLGEATARALAARGAKVAVFDRDADKGEKVAGEIGWELEPSRAQFLPDSVGHWLPFRESNAAMDRLANALPSPVTATATPESQL